MANTLKFGAGEWATKKGSTLAYNDENGNFKPLPFDFERAGSATRVNKEGLIEVVGNNEPRIDFKDNTKGALLLEPQRTNYVLKSNDFSLLSGGFVTPNYGTSPEGLSVSRILFTDANQSMSSGTSLSAGVVCNFSAYVKGIKGQFIKFAAGGVDIAHTFSGEWERLSGSATSINNSWNLNTYGYATARDFLLCGAQLEQGSYATSYIPTSGGVVTRVADVCNNSGNEQVINSTEGVFYLNVASNGLNPSFDVIALSDGTPNNRVLFDYTSSDNQIELFLRVGGVNIFGSTTSVPNDENFIKAAIKWKDNDCSIWLNGVKINSTSNANVYPANTLDRLNFDIGTGTNSFYGKCKDLRVYNKALTDAELQALTKI